MISVIQDGKPRHMTGMGFYEYEPHIQLKLPIWFQFVFCFKFSFWKLKYIYFDLIYPSFFTLTIGIITDVNKQIIQYFDRLYTDVEWEWLRQSLSGIARLSIAYTTGSHILYPAFHRNRLLPFDQQGKGEDREVNTRHAKEGNTLKTIEYIKQNWRSISWFCVHWMVQTADELEGNKRKGNNGSQRKPKR